MSYLSDTPYYRIWMDVIEIMAPAFSFLIAKGYAFQNIVCDREGVQKNYIQGGLKVQIKVNIEFRMLEFYRLTASGNKIDSNIFAFKEAVQTETVFDRNSLKEIVTSWKDSLITSGTL